MILESPQLKPMLDANPAMRSMFSNPTFLQSLMSPQNIQNMMNLMNPGQNNTTSLPNSQPTQPDQQTSQSSTNSQPNTFPNQLLSNLNTPLIGNPFVMPDNNPFFNPLMFGNLQSILY